VWRGDLWKQFIHWWLLSPRDLRISFRIQDCVKLKPQVASKPFYGLSPYNPFSKGGCSLHTLNIRLCHQDTLELVEARYLGDGRSGGACKYFIVQKFSPVVFTKV
jgi:hypothetical protein